MAETHDVIDQACLDLTTMGWTLEDGDRGGNVWLSHPEFPGELLVLDADESG